MTGAFSSRLQRAWYDNSRWPYLLLPLSWCLQALSGLRRFYYCHIAKAPANPVPVVVVGNINVGGTGKTPLIIALARQLTEQRLKVGIISRGYGSAAPQYPYAVTENSSVTASGDEALLIAKATGCPVVISPRRRQALQALLAQHACDIVLSDDGLQHYALAREYEIAVIDGGRALGNGWVMPAGPLRESAARLKSVDCIVVNGELNRAFSFSVPHFTMQLKSSLWRRVSDNREGTLAEIGAFDRVHAVTGIGNPQRFYQSLREMNVDINPHSFPDHHHFALTDIIFNDDLPVVMTGKDAVKCQALLAQSQLSARERQRYWYVPVEARLPDAFYQQLIERLTLNQTHQPTPETGARTEV